MSDSADLEAVVGVTRACLRSPSAMWGSGPHTLAHIISTSGHFGKYVCISLASVRRTTLWHFYCKPLKCSEINYLKIYKTHSMLYNIISEVISI